MMTPELADILAIGALKNVRYRMEFSECYEEGVRNVAAAIFAAVEAAVLEERLGTITYFGE